MTRSESFKINGILAIGLLLVGLGFARVVTGSAGPTSGPAVVEVTARLANVPVTDSGCAVSGDLVGDGNPADVYVALCGR